MIPLFAGQLELRRGGQLLDLLRLGGADDGDLGKNGRFVPTIGSDQVGATLLQWLGVSSTNFVNVFPDLANFQTKTIPLFRS